MGCISQCYVLNGEEERLPLQPEGYAPEDRGNMCCIKKSLNVIPLHHVVRVLIIFHK